MVISYHGKKTQHRKPDHRNYVGQNIERLISQIRFGQVYKKYYRKYGNFGFMYSNYDDLAIVFQCCGPHLLKTLLFRLEKFKKYEFTLTYKSGFPSRTFLPDKNLTLFGRTLAASLQRLDKGTSPFRLKEKLLVLILLS